MKKDIDTFIKEHEHVCYCEAIIYRDGSIEYANPSHLKTLIRATGKSEEEIWNEMLNNASPIDWLVIKSRCIAIWYEGYKRPGVITMKQLNSLKQLIDNNIILNDRWETRI